MLRASIPVLASALLAASQPASAQPLPNLTHDQLEAAIADRQLGKIAVLGVEQHGEVLYLERFDGEAAGTPIDIRSAGKSITALAVGAAIADGKLSGPDLKVWPYLGSARGEPWDSITVADLLGMSSALDCNDWDKRSPGQEERMYRTRAWREFALGLPARDYKRDERGAGTFSYCTAGVFLLGQVVEKATGERFDRYVQRRLFDPLEIEGVDWRSSRSGEIQSGGQLTIEASALLKLGRLVLDRGQWQGVQLLPEEWIETMLAPRHRLGDYLHYGSLWWATLVKTPSGLEEAWMMKGNGGNIVAVLRDYDAVLVVQAENYNREDAERHAFTALTALATLLEPPSALTEE